MKDRNRLVGLGHRRPCSSGVVEPHLTDRCRRAQSFSSAYYRVRRNRGANRNAALSIGVVGGIAVAFFTVVIRVAGYRFAPTGVYINRRCARTPRESAVLELAEILG